MSPDDPAFCVILISPSEAAKELGVSRSRMGALLKEGRIEGAQQVGRAWVIPAPVRLLPTDAQKRRYNL